jgi:hypothetical protein
MIEIMSKVLDPTLKKTEHSTVTKGKSLLLSSENFALYNEIRTKPMNTLYGKNKKIINC